MASLLAEVSVTCERIQAKALPMPAGLVDSTAPILIFPLGQPPSNDGRKWRFEQEDLQAVVEAFAKRTEPLPILYSHGEDKARGKEAAGWIDAIELHPDGLYGAVRWTSDAQEAIRAGKWAFRSPGFDAETDTDGFIRPRALAEVSLVNDPAIGGMPPVVAEKQLTEVLVKEKTKTGALETLAMVRDALGLDANATVSQIAMEFKKCIDGADEAPEMEEMKKEPPNDMPAAEAVPAAPVAQVSEADRIKLELASAEKREQVVSTIRKATADGRITAGTREAAIRLASADLDAFNTFLTALPVSAPAAGQVVTASAGDRAAKPLTYAEQVRAERNQRLGVTA
jgi:phage I-like protein